jgi:membrane-associated protein
LFETFTEYVSGSPWTYAYLFAVAAIDVVFPVVPSEASVITAGVVAATGGLIIWAVILIAAAGAVLGDNTSYWIGRRAGPWIVRRFFHGERKKRIDWAEEQIQERGPYLIVIGRFIPGGRTAITFASGLLRMRWHRFIGYDVSAGLVWATYAALLGYFGGKAFQEEPLKGLIIAFAIALFVAAAVELYRWLRKRRVLARG